MVPAGKGGDLQSQEAMQAVSFLKAESTSEKTKRVVPQTLKRHLEETDRQVLTSVCYQDRRAAHQYLVRILPEGGFEYPKDHRVLQRLFEVVTSNDDIVLDSFAGSGTTAHAVLALNKEDGGNRRFILVECEDYADTITAERVRRVIKGVPSAKDESLRNGLGGTFSYFKLGKPMRKESMLTRGKLPSYERLAGYIFFTATGEEFDAAEMRRERHFIGRSRNYDVFLIYTDDFEQLKDMALTKDMASKLSRGKRPKLVFAPTKYLDQEFLHRYGITFQQLPFEIYETVDRLGR